MGADNVVLLFILVWTLTPVCQADDDDISVSCDDVTGAVGEEVTFTCNVSLKRSECCITNYKFQYPKIYNDTDICKQEFPQDSCEQRNSFTCRYTPTTAMTGQFRFYLQTKCGPLKTEFTVNITEPSKPETVTEDHRKKEPIKPETVSEDHRKKEPIKPLTGTGHGSTGPMFTGAVIGCIIIIIIFIVGMSVFCVKRFKRSNTSGFQIEYERGASEEPTMTTTVNIQNETKREP